MDYQGADQLPPHVLIFPFPLQGHVNCMLKLAELLCLARLHVTFLVTDHTHRRLLRHSNVQSHFARYAGFRFETISDGLPEDDPHSGDHKVMEMLHSFKDTAKPLLRELLISDRESGNSSSSGKAIACVIADGLMSFVVDVGEEIGIPVIYFRTSSACHFWALFCVPKLIDAGELPFPDNNLDVPIKSIPGMDNFLRRRDLSSFFRVGNLADRGFQILVNETLQTTRVQALILNTFEELEGPILAQLRSQLPKIYTIGPLHAHLKTRLTTPNASNSLWEEDRSCMTWLDAQPSKSVIYVSFGSITMVTQDQLMEFWHGLLNSGKQFLWVIRPDSLVGKEKESQIPAELVEGTRERGHLVGWAPQEEVLAHQAVGGFITHSGWNSTLESVAAGVPMICWPYFGDQQINSRLVGEVLKLGLDMKDSCDRVIIENMVRDLMDMRREEFTESTDRMAKMAKEAISEGGSSYCSLEHLIDNIRFMSTTQSPS